MPLNNNAGNGFRKIVIKSENIFYYTMIVMLFQITRNISTVAYVAILFSLYITLYLVYFIENRDGMFYKFRIGSLLFLFSYIWVTFISLKNINMGEFIVALPRYMITFPFILFCFIYKKYSKQFVIKVLKCYCNFMTVASLSIPYQIIFGEIFFFTQSSSRAGLDRYASLAGSLTALGSLGAISLIILLFSGYELYSQKKKIILITITTLAMLMTLQKAALANIIICFLTYFLFNNNIKLSRRIFGSLGLLILMSLIYFLIKDTILGSYISSVFSYSFSDSSIGIKEDLLSRFWSLPSRVIKYNNMNVIDFALGIGFPALAGTMGLPNYPMAHNNYFDLILSGGLIHFVSYMFLLLSIPFKVIIKKSKRLNVTNVDMIYSMTILIVLINMMIGGASFYQPVFAVIVFFMICSYNSIS